MKTAIINRLLCFLFISFVNINFAATSSFVPISNDTIEVTINNGSCYHTGTGYFYNSGNYIVDFYDANNFFIGSSTYFLLNNYSGINLVFQVPIHANVVCNSSAKLRYVCNAQNIELEIQGDYRIKPFYINTLESPTVLICEKEEVTLNISTNIPNDSVYFWFATNDNPNIEGESTNTQFGAFSDSLINNSTTLQQLVYSISPVTSYYGNTCVSYNQHYVTVKVKPKNPEPPSIFVNHLDSLACEGRILQVSLPPNSGYTSYIWSNGESFYQIFDVSAGTYFVKATNGCNDTILSNIIEVFPRPYLTEINDTLYGCGNISLNLELQANEACTYTWVGVYSGGFGIVSGVSTTTQLTNVIDDNITNISTQDSPNISYLVYATSINSGCVSVAQIPLTVKVFRPNITSDLEYVYTCESNYFWQGNTYTEDGIYYANSTNSFGCDSTLRVRLFFNQPSSSETVINSCGNSYTWNGNYYSTSGIFTNYFTNSVGCDSIATLNLTISQPSSSSETITACENYLWNGINYSNSGTYTANLLNSNGCDSIVTLNLTITGLPTVNLNNFSSVCDTLDSFDLTGGAPAGGQYSGTSVSSNQFNPIIGAGNYTIIYTYTDANSCTNSDNANIQVITCTSTASINENNQNQFKIYPNPTSTSLTISFAVKQENEKICVYSISGQKLHESTITDDNLNLDVSTFSKGIYFIEIGNTREKIVVE